MSDGSHLTLGLAIAMYTRAKGFLPAASYPLHTLPEAHTLHQHTHTLNALHILSQYSAGQETQNCCESKRSASTAVNEEASVSLWLVPQKQERALQCLPK